LKFRLPFLIFVTIPLLATHVYAQQIVNPALSPGQSTNTFVVNHDALPPPSLFTSPSLLSGPGASQQNLFSLGKPITLPVKKQTGQRTDIPVTTTSTVGGQTVKAESLPPPPTNLGNAPLSIPAYGLSSTAITHPFLSNSHPMSIGSVNNNHSTPGNINAPGLPPGPLGAVPPGIHTFVAPPIQFPTLSDGMTRVQAIEQFKKEFAHRHGGGVSQIGPDGKPIVSDTKPHNNIENTPHAHTDNRRPTETSRNTGCLSGDLVQMLSPACMKNLPQAAGLFPFSAVGMPTVAPPSKQVQCAIVLISAPSSPPAFSTDSIKHCLEAGIKMSAGVKGVFNITATDPTYGVSGAICTRPGTEGRDVDCQASR
jgi:hypothetical protein